MRASVQQSSFGRCYEYSISRWRESHTLAHAQYKALWNLTGFSLAQVVYFAYFFFFFLRLGVATFKVLNGEPRNDRFSKCITYHILPISQRKKTEGPGMFNVGIVSCIFLPCESLSHFHTFCPINKPWSKYSTVQFPPNDTCVKSVRIHGEVVMSGLIPIRHNPTWTTTIRMRLAHELAVTAPRIESFFNFQSAAEHPRRTAAMQFEYSSHGCSQKSAEHLAQILAVQASNYATGNLCTTGAI